MRALLINPPTGRYIREDRCQVPVDRMIVPSMRPPIDLGYMASALEKTGVECRIRDYPAEGCEWNEFEKDLSVFNPGLLVISTTSPTLKKDMEALRLAKRIKPEILTVAKGAPLTTSAPQIMREEKALDISIKGECEKVVAGVLTAGRLERVRGIVFRLNGTVIETEAGNFIEDLDNIGEPARHLMRNEIYLRPDTQEMQTTVLASRGCPHNCMFCLARTVHGDSLRARLPERLAMETKECRERFGIKNFYFQADTFTLNREWVMKACDELIKLGVDCEWVCNSRVDSVDEEMLKKMREAGCWGIAFGIESGCEDILRATGKMTTCAQAKEAIGLCKKNGIKTSLMFMIGLPWDDLRTVAKTISFARTLDGDVTELNIAYPFPGTEFHRKASSWGLMKTDDLTGYDFTKASTSTFKLSSKSVDRLRVIGLITIYARPSYILRTLLSAPSGTVALNYMKFGWKKLKSFFAIKR